MRALDGSSSYGTATTRWGSRTPRPISGLTRYSPGTSRASTWTKRGMRARMARCRCCLAGDGGLHVTQPGKSSFAGNVGIGTEDPGAFRLKVEGGDTGLDGALMVTKATTLQDTLMVTKQTTLKRGPDRYGGAVIRWSPWTEAHLMGRSPRDWDTALHDIFSNLKPIRLVQGGGVR